MNNKMKRYTVRYSRRKTPQIPCFWGFLESLSHGQNWLLTSFLALLFSQENEGQSKKFQAFNYGFLQYLKRREYQTTLPSSCEICMQVKKQQLELNMEQQTGSKLGKECWRLHIVTLII